LSSSRESAPRPEMELVKLRSQLSQVVEGLESGTF
jgi:hypothetical protein